ncbi:hypothetical protein AB0J82_22495 [Asanoa sp. NPDC049518]|uniref:hypothetical protein n=1 Tax=unclassified Asanoa TaxID=2685164 RepID=UPI003420DE35
MRNLPSRRALSVVGVVLVLAVAGIVLWSQRADSGVEACEQMAAGNASMTAIRPLFAESRHDDLRDHGGKMIDAAEAYGNPNAGSDRRDTELKIERQAVQTACADHGVTVELV